MRILVTGGAGFIGFHVCKALLERGEEVINIDHFNSAYSPQVKEDRNKILESFPHYLLYRKDISEFEQLKEVFQNHKIDKICHLAAKAGVLPSIKDPFSYQRTNVLGTLNILHAAQEFGVNQVVAASSSSVYGKNEKFPSSEEDVVDYPISLYAATKKSAEVIAHYYHHLFGMNITMLRFFNVYGEWGRPDQMPWIFTESILQGKTINLNNGGDTWKDYTYVADITRGVLAALDQPLGYQIINLGNSHPEHLKKCLEIIERETGKKALRQLQPMQPGDVLMSYADVQKAKRLLGWEPMTNIETGLANFVRWYKEYKGLGIEKNEN